MCAGERVGFMAARTTRGGSAMHRVGQNHINTPCMTVYLVISLPKMPYICRFYVWLWQP
jgi:hypothetical protein